MSSVAQIISFKASEVYRSGTGNFDRPLAQLGQANGLKKSYAGQQIEGDDTVVFWVNDWVSKAARDAWAQQPDFEGLKAAARPAFDSEPTIHYVEFENTKGPLGAPITEFVTFTLKEGNSIDQLEPLVQALHQKLNDLNIPGFHGDSWGQIIDKPNIYHGILGWDTVDAHWNAVKDGPLKERIDRVRVVADLWLVHAALKATS